MKNTNELLNLVAGLTLLDDEAAAAVNGGASMDPLPVTMDPLPVYFHRRRSVRIGK